MRRSILLLPIALLVLHACSGSEGPASYTTADQGGMERTRAINAESAPIAERGAATPMLADRKIIRSGSLSYEVEDLDTARATILAHVERAGGYVERDERGDWGATRNVSVTVRIPAERFDGFVEGMGTLGRLEHRSINAADVTTEWVDVEARLAALRTLEARYLELAAQAKNVPEMLEVERALGQVRMEIESMEARMKSLRDQVALSTLSITCTKRVAHVERFTPRFGVALREGWNNLLRFLVGLVHLWPFVIVMGLLLWWWRRRRRSVRRKD